MTTHFNDEDSLDLDAMKRLTEYYVEQKVPTVIVTGSTGESARNAACWMWLRPSLRVEST